MSDRAVSLLAFVQRASGFYPRGMPSVDVIRRATGILRDLSRSPDDLKFRLSLAQLPYHWDLLTEEATMVPEALQLQVRLIDLCQTVPAAMKQCREQFEGPLGRLVAAILAQGWQDGASEAEVSFDQSPTKIRYRVADDWIDSLTVPSTLSGSLRGKLRLIEEVSFSKVRPLFPPQIKLPNNVILHWETADRLNLRLS